MNDESSKGCSYFASLPVQEERQQPEDMIALVARVLKNEEDRQAQKYIKARAARTEIEEKRKAACA